MAEENLRGEDARLEHPSSGEARWSDPPCRKSFFNGLDQEIVQLIHRILREAQRQAREDTKTTSPNIFGGKLFAENLAAAVVQEHITLPPEASEGSSPEIYVGHTDGAGDDETAAAAMSKVKQQTQPISPQPQEHVPRENPAKTVHIGSSDGPNAVQNETTEMSPRLPLIPERPRPDPIRLREFARRTASQHRTAAITSILREWALLTVRMRCTRNMVDARFERRQKVRDLAAKRRFLVGMKSLVSEKVRARAAAKETVRQRREAAARAVLSALASNLERGRETELAAETLRRKVEVASARRAQTDVIHVLSRACSNAKKVRQKADDMRAEGVLRASYETFGAWATAAGLAGRLRKRFGRADKALLTNVIIAWGLFSRHSVDKRLRKQDRAEEKKKRSRLRAWDTEIIDVAFADWANFAAAGKFRRMRLATRTLRGWRKAARAFATGTAANFKMSREKRQMVLACARKEAETRFSLARRQKLAEYFKSWAVEAGLACCLCRRMGQVEVALIHSAFRAWDMFARHAVRRREARANTRAAARRNTETLRTTIIAWADVTAASKFWRLRLRHKVFVAWRAALCGL